MVPFKEYRMSMFQVVSLSGIVMGCMLLAFYLGVYFGNKIGFENAMNESRENLAKVPIDLSDTGKDDVDEKTVNQVYEKLKKDSLNEDFDNDLPTLAKIAEDINQNEDNGKNDKGDKINILGNDEVPDVVGGNKKAIGEYVEDINFAGGDDGQKVKKDIIKGSDEDKEDVALVVDGVDTESEDIKAEIKDVKKKIDEHLEKEKDVNKDDIKPVFPNIIKLYRIPLNPIAIAILQSTSLAFKSVIVIIIKHETQNRAKIVLTLIPNLINVKQNISMVRSSIIGY